MVLVVLVFTIASVSAQEDIDVDSMDNEQLTTLLLQILNKLQQEEAPAVETDPESVKPASEEATAVPAADPETIEEIFQITIYDNKKLIVEALPEYMFIQKPVGGSDGSSEPGESFSSPEDCYKYCANLDWGNNEGYAQCVKEKCGADKPPQIQSDWRR